MQKDSSLCNQASSVPAASSLGGVIFRNSFVEYQRKRVWNYRAPNHPLVPLELSLLSLSSLNGSNGNDNNEIGVFLW